MTTDRPEEDESRTAAAPRRSYRSATRLATIAGRPVTLRASDFATQRRRESLDATKWRARGAVEPDAEAGRQAIVRGNGAAEQLVWRKPGVYAVSATLNGRLHTKGIVVGLNLDDLVHHPEHYDDFFYCLVARVDKKVYFLPIRPGGRKPDTHGKRQLVLQQAAQNESGYRTFTDHQDETYACSILQHPHIEPASFRDGVYAVWDDRVHYVGTYRGLSAGLGNLEAALDHDANVTLPEDANPGDVFNTINQLFDAFDPTSLLGNGSDFSNPSDLFGPDVDGGWVAANIGDVFGSFEDHLGGLGFDVDGGEGMGCMFGFNTDNATFSSRFSDDGMGIYRQSTNMIDPSGGSGGDGGMGISQMVMLSDGTNDGGGAWVRGAYWDEGSQVLVLGASSPDEVRTIDGYGVDQDGDIIIVVNTPDPPPDPEPGTGGDSGVPTGDTEGTSGTGSTDGTSGTDGTAGTDGTGGGTDGTDGGTDGTDGGTGGTPTGSPEIPNPDDTNSGGGGGGGPFPGARRIPISRFPIGQRGCGYTDPAPDYDGSGGSNFGHWLGFVPPMGDHEWSGLVNPGPIVGMGAGLPPFADDAGAAGGFAGGAPGPGGMGLDDDGFMDWENTCPDVPQRVSPQMAEQREMERLQGLLGRVGRGAAVQTDGMFSMARKFNCEGYSEKPRWIVSHGRFLDRAVRAKYGNSNARDILRNALKR